MSISMHKYMLIYIYICMQMEYIRKGLMIVDVCCNSKDLVGGFNPTQGKSTLDGFSSSFRCESKKYI